MKKFLINLIKFIPFAIAFYIVCTFIFGISVPQIFKPNINYSQGYIGFAFSRLNELKKINGKLDFLFLGSSHSYRGLDPRNFGGYRCFNLGTSAQTPLQTELLLNRYSERIKTKSVILEVNPESFSSDGVESGLDIISNDKNDCESLCMAFRINNPKIYNTLIYATLRDILGLNNSYSEPKEKDGDFYIKGGFVERKLSYYKQVKIPENNDLKINPKQLAAFDRIISNLKKRGINIIIVYAPITSALYNSYPNNEHFDSLMKGYGTQFYDFNKLLQLNDSIDFYDKQHLNSNGVEIYNRVLLKLIKK